MIGPIKGKRLACEIKLQIVRAVAEAKRQGLSFERACEVIMLDPAGFADGSTGVTLNR